MIDKDRIAIEEEITREHHCAIGRANDVITGRGGDIQAAVRSSWLIVEKAF